MQAIFAYPLAQAYEDLVHFSPTVKQRQAFAKAGVAMPDGSFYIRNQADLDNAIGAVGRATPNADESETARRNSVRRHIMSRARTLKLTNMIPDTWNPDGTLKQSDLMSEVEAYLAHFGVRGMRWGVRRRSGDTGAKPSSSAPSNHPSFNAPRPRLSSDATTARALQGVVRKRGTGALSNQELQELVTRLNLEGQYSQLNSRQVNAGRKFTEGIIRDSGKQIATQFIVKNAPKGAAWLAKYLAKKGGSVKNKPAT
jgi:hypothetical protein